MTIKVLQRIGWVMVAVGIALAIVFVSGLAHPMSAQLPSTVASYDSHHRWVVTGFVLSMVGAAILLVTEWSRRNQEIQEPKAWTTPVDGLSITRAGCPDRPE